MCLPSGDQAGCRALPKESVIAMASPPSTGMIQIRPKTSKAMVWPSGETAAAILVPWSMFISITSWERGSCFVDSQPTTARAMMNKEIRELFIWMIFRLGS